MKFVLREYIGLLKEDKELDSLLSDLLFNMGVVPLTKPMRGRQHGVDISAAGLDPEDGKKKLFLLIAKQGDFSRANWNNGVNAIRPTLDEVLDVYLRTHVPKQYSRTPKKIIVCCNGELHQNVNLNWTSYINKYHKKGKLEFEFWGIDKLVDLIDNYSISEQMFSREDRLLLRKTLSFLDLPDYDLRHYYELVKNILEKTNKRKNSLVKKVRLCSLCLNILFKWSQEINNLKPVVIASERLLLSLWDWIKAEDLFNKPVVLKEFYKLHLQKLQIGRSYFAKLQKHCYVKDALYSNTRTHIEYSLVTWEQVGLISLVGLTEVFELNINTWSNRKSEADLQTYQSNAISIADGLMNLIENNPPSKSAKYDEHVIEVVLVSIFLVHTKNIAFVSKWLRQLAANLVDGYRFTKFFPLFHTNYDKLVSIELGDEKAEITSSVLLAILAEWACIIDDSELYKMVRRMATEIFKDIDLQIWFPENDTEDAMYSRDATHKTGSVKHSIELPELMDEYRTEMAKERKLFAVELEMSFFKTGFYYLGYVASRHFRTYPLPMLWRAFVPDIDETAQPFKEEA